MSAGGLAAPTNAAAGWLAWLERALAPYIGPLIFLSFALTVLDLVVVRHTVAGDYMVFHTAGARFLHGEPLYRLAQGWEYKYAPGVAAFFAPFSLLPPRVAWAVFGLLTAAALTGFLQWCAREFGGSRKVWSQLLLLALVNPFASHLLGMGQVDGVLLWVMAVSESISERRPIASGLLWGTAVVVKPPFLAFAVIVAASRRHRRFLGLAAALCAFFALGSLRYGLAGHLEQLVAWRSILQETTPSLLCFRQNQSAFSIACTYLAEPGSRWYAAAIAAIALTLLVPAAWACYRARVDRAAALRTGVAVTFYATALMSPLGWRGNLLASAPLLALLVAQARAGQGVARGLAVGVLVAMLCAEHVLLRYAQRERLLEQRYLALLVLAAAVSALLGVVHQHRSAPKN